MPRRGRSLMPPHWPPTSFSGAMHEGSQDDQDDGDDEESDAHDPLARLKAITASPAWTTPAEGASQALVPLGANAPTLPTDAYRDELEQIGREIANLRLLLLQAEREIETQTQRRDQAEQEVAKVEQRLQQHSHEEIRAAYTHASETEMRAFMASEQRDQMLAKLQAFERYERFLRGAIEALDAATAVSPRFPEGDATTIWDQPTHQLASGDVADEVSDEDDDYETMWMTPTSSFPAVKLTPAPTLPYHETEPANLRAAVPSTANTPNISDTPRDEPSHADFAAERADHPARSMPLPRPQLPDDQSPWITRVTPDESDADQQESAAEQSRHVVVMGPRTASLAFRGEEQGQWEGAHAVLNRVVQAQEEVAERVARQIQDVSLRALTQIALEADYYEHQAATDPNAALEGLQQVRAQLHAALQSANSALLSVRPMGDGGTSLIGALRRYAMSITTQYNLPFQLQTPDREHPLAPETVKQAFRVGQEAMLNAARHAHASLLIVSVSYTSDAMRLVIEDDGVGFDAEHEVNRAIKRSGGGLLGMLERAELLGGGLRIDSMPGDGCNVELLLPLPRR